MNASTCIVTSEKIAKIYRLKVWWQSERLAMIIRLDRIRILWVSWNVMPKCVKYSIWARRMCTFPWECLMISSKQWVTRIYYFLHLCQIRIKIAFNYRFHRIECRWAHRHCNIDIDSLNKQHTLLFFIRLIFCVSNRFVSDWSGQYNCASRFIYFWIPTEERRRSTFQCLKGILFLHIAMCHTHSLKVTYVWLISAQMFDNKNE